MDKQQSPVDVAVEILRDLEEFERTGSKQAFREAIREEFVRRSGASSTEQALLMAMASLIKQIKSKK
jgi:hypothetical protein